MGINSDAKDTASYSTTNGNGSTEKFDKWPRDMGLVSGPEIKTPLELQITGTIPAYAAGVLYRTGPGKWEVDTDKGTIRATHWFDGFSQVHRFDIRKSTDSSSPTKVFYNSRMVTDMVIQKIRENKKFTNFTFGQRDPCKSFFSKVMSAFDSGAGDEIRSPDDANIGVAMTMNMPGLVHQYPKNTPEPGKEGIKSIMTRTDAATYQFLDPTTLEPVGLAQQTKLHPDLKGPLSAAHSKTCPKTGDVFNYNLDIGKESVYRVFKASATTNETTILATIKTAPASYLHSSFISENYIILCVWNAHYSYRGMTLLYYKNILDSIAPMDPNKPATWYVIDRTSAQKGVVATYTTPPFFAFHAVNAWEEPSKTKEGEKDLICEVPQFKDLDILKRFYYDNLTSGSTEQKAIMPELTRYRFANVSVHDQPPANGKPATPNLREGEILWKAPANMSMELPTFNPQYATRPHRYVYGIIDAGICPLPDGLVKFDTETQTHKVWTRHGHAAGEAIFVPDPAGDVNNPADEDKGVLLSVICDGPRACSYLLVLDAKTMEEVGRADVGQVVGMGFHGMHLPEQKVRGEVQPLVGSTEA